MYLLGKDLQDLRKKMERLNPWLKQAEAPKTKIIIIIIIIIIIAELCDVSKGKCLKGMINKENNLIETEVGSLKHCRFTTRKGCW